MKFYIDTQGSKGFTLAKKYENFANYFLKIKLKTSALSFYNVHFYMGYTNKLIRAKFLECPNPS